MIQILLSMPDSRLSLNYHPKRVKDRIELKHVQQAYRDYAYEITMRVLNGAKPFNKADRMKITFVFHKKSKAKYDLDNLVMKHAQDGIFKALGLDDGAIDESTKVRGEINKEQPYVLIIIDKI